MSDKKLTIQDSRNGNAYELPILSPTRGQDMVNIASLPKQSGMYTFDPGFTATGSTESKITFLDGEKGELFYRGYPIEQLAEKCNYLEVCYLLLNGELPNREQREDFNTRIMRRTMLTENIRYGLMRSFNHDAHPMAMLTGVVGSLSAFYHKDMDIYDPEIRQLTAHRLIAKMPTIAAGCYKHNIGQPMQYPQNNLSFTGNFLKMMFGNPCEEYEIDPVAEKALDILFILHADHEQNASTSTVRLASSTGCNPYAAIASGVAALWGPAHGGANEAVLNMLDEIGSVENIDKYLAKAKDKNDPFRLMGFGHRVYKNYDPRAKLIKTVCHDVLAKYGNDPRLELALRLEEIALSDEYFVERKLYPNVDFYSGIIYAALGIPVNMFTVMFAVARTVGWISHWNEMVEDPKMRIGRPRQLYTGYDRRDVPDIASR